MRAADDRTCAHCGTRHAFWPCPRHVCDRPGCVNGGPRCADCDGLVKHVHDVYTWRSPLGVDHVVRDNVCTTCGKTTHPRPNTGTYNADWVAGTWFLKYPDEAMEVNRIAGMIAAELRKERQDA